MSTPDRHPSLLRLLIFGLLPIVLTVGLWLLQSLAIQHLSQQFREVGYIEYGWFRRPQGSAAQFWIILFPFIGSFIALFGFGVHVHRAVPTGQRQFMFLLWPLLSFLFVVLSIRTLMIAIQGYALIFI